MKTLQEIGLFYGTDKAKSHKFCDFYESYFNYIRYEKLNILEIGIWHGESLKMLEEYFENSNVCAIDINNCKQYETDRIKTEIADQSKPEDLAKLFPNVNFDIIIDDGSHYMSHQQISIACLFKRLNKHGFYVIEDLHTSFMPNYTEGNSYEGTTHFMLSNFNNAHEIKSKYMSNEDIKYLEQNIEFIEVHKVKEGSITSMIKKI